MVVYYFLLALFTLVVNRMLSNAIAGRALKISNKFDIGNRVVIYDRNNRIAGGSIRAIGFFSTALTTYENNVVYIPNAKLIDEYIIERTEQIEVQNRLFNMYVHIADAKAAGSLIKEVLTEANETENTLSSTSISIKAMPNETAELTYNIIIAGTVDDAYNIAYDINARIIDRLLFSGIHFK